VFHSEIEDDGKHTAAVSWRGVVMGVKETPKP